jgi:hypothetical protein
MATLTVTVHVKNPKTGETEVFGPGVDVPAWAKKAITNPNVWDEEPEPSKPAARRSRKTADKAPDGDESPDDPGDDPES